MKKALIMKEADNVATVIENVEAGEQISARIGDRTKTLVTEEKIPFGFKVALTDIPKGESVKKYGEVIGKASVSIKKGQLVHIHNVEGTRGRGDLIKRGKEP